MPSKYIIKGKDTARDGCFLRITNLMDRYMDNKTISITRDITCLHCDHNGLMDIHDERENIADGRLFVNLGHNPFSGDLHFQCPACGIVLLVDPMLALGKRPIKGIPQLLAGQKALNVTGALEGFISGLLNKAIWGESKGPRLF